MNPEVKELTDLALEITHGDPEEAIELIGEASRVLVEMRVPA